MFKKSVVKFFYHDLKRKMKFTHNPRPIESEFKNDYYTRANIVTYATTL